jgi:hypothetical protein
MSRLHWLDKSPQKICQLGKSAGNGEIRQLLEVINQKEKGIQ